MKFHNVSKINVVFHRNICLLGKDQYFVPKDHGVFFFPQNKNSRFLNLLYF